MGRTRAERRAGRAIRRQRRVVEQYRALARADGYELTDWQVRMLAALQKTIDGVQR
ncbi:hypothetical protein DEU35_1454 [Microbacterium sp. AG157]|uniref:hypothetical protein n=1 Tax=Microbacterium sp. AG157 TaxID=2183993 RepID=UPI000E36644F|nr:hypothetical protein [Microbacterium sp. AG157]REC98354.1 hypothetical protein DEU35_1454 [Microbacterium sp. AG157]